MILAFICAFVAYVIAHLIASSGKKDLKPLIPPNGNLLILDTETNGPPVNWKASSLDTSNWPGVISIAWNTITPKGKSITSKSFMIKPDGFFISGDGLHQTSVEPAKIVGIKLTEVLQQLDQDVNASKYLIAHNIEFHYPVVYSEYLRQGIDTGNLSSLKRICTMKQSLEFCKIKTTIGYKFPTLKELYYKLFSREMNKDHKAQVGAQACMQCFKELYNRSVIIF